MLARFAENVFHFPFENLYTLSQLPRFQRFWNYASFKLHGQPPYFHQVIRRERPSLLHAHFGTEGVYALPLRHVHQLPLITTFYGKDMSQQATEPKWQRGYQQLFAQGELFLVEGSHMQSELVKLGCPENKIRISHIGVDTQKFHFLPRAKPETGPIHLLMCGRLVEKKGVAYAIEALSYLVTDYPQLQLKIIGDGPLRPELERLIQERHVQKHVQILGYLSHDNYAKEMATAHIFLAPSVLATDGDSEGGAPTVLLEAQASGVLILASTHADIPEVVGVKEPGYLVPERDGKTLAANLRQMLESPYRWLEWAKIGRQHIETEYDIQKVTRSLEAIYDEVIAKFPHRQK